MRIAVLGSGKVGSALFRLLEREASHQVTLSPGRRLPRRAPAADLFVIAVRDAAITELAAELARREWLPKRAAVIHVAGSLGPEALAPLKGRVAGVGQAHPMLSFASRRHPPELQGAHLLVAGDPVALRRTRIMARALGMRARRWDDVDRPTYHAAGSVLANTSVALAAAASRLLEQAGVGDAADRMRVLAPLLRSVADNLEHVGLPAALTGPVRRGDVSTVEAQLSRLRRQAPELEPLFLAALELLIPLAAALGDATPEELGQLRRLAQLTR